MKPEELIKREALASLPVEPGCVVYVENMNKERFIVKSVHGNTITVYNLFTDPTEIPISWAVRVDDI